MDGRGAIFTNFPLPQQTSDSLLMTVLMVSYLPAEFAGAAEEGREDDALLIEIPLVELLVDSSC